MRKRMTECVTKWRKHPESFQERERQQQKAYKENQVKQIED